MSRTFMKEVFTIDNYNKTCSRELDAIEVWDQWAGVPDDAVGVTFGWLDRFKLTMSRYTLIRNGGDTDALITMDVKADTICTPIRVTFQDAHLDPMAGEMVNYEFLDVRPLSDPTVFHTPTHCSKDTSPENKWVQKLLPSRRTGLFVG
ncbi:uncharacterized protein [Argopecten irradians]|uniref:uncharacterized protein isoform X2 n=1 Tax=Argopecten irradians TaxID=31199 RepID=UPI0037236D63